MATIDKNFRIKNGLVVEGTTGTINGQAILTETGSDAYILNLIGGETLVKSVDTDVFNVDGEGYLTIQPNTFDSYGSAASAQTAAEGYADTAATTAENAAKAYADGLASNYDEAGAAATAQANAESFATTAANNAQTAAESYADSLASNYDPAGAAYDAQIAAAEYTDEAALTAENNAKSYADGLASNYDAAGAAATAESNANSYTDSAISNEVTARDAAIATAKGEATAYTDTAVANLVDGAPELLDTLNELAAAIADNPNYATDVANLVATKADTSYVDSEISDLDTAAQGYASEAQAAAEATASADATSKANAAETAAKSYADDLAVNYDAAGAAATAESNANSYTDAEVSDVLDGTSIFTEINVNDVASQVAATTGNIATAAATTALSWAKADYRSAKLLVKVKNGNHTQVSDLVVTLDTSDNVGVSEYGITYSNGTSLADVSADVSGSDVRIRVTPVNANTEVIVFGTLIK